MPDQLHHRDETEHPPIYEIRLGGHLDAAWGDWFPGMAVTREEDGDMLLTGPVADQAALHGLFRRVRDLGVPLIAVGRVERGRTSSSTKKARRLP